MAIAAIAMIGCGPKAAQEKAEGAENAEKAPIRINCLVKVTPENRDAVIALSKELVDSSRTDAGNIDYDLYESANDPSKLIIFETWEDQASLDVHSAAPHFTRLVPQIQEKSEMTIQVMTEEPQPDKTMRLNCMLNFVGDDRDAAIEAKVEKTLSKMTLYLSTTDPTKMMFFETWKDQASLDAHAAAEHSKQHIENTKGLSESKLEKFLLPEE